jgi:osmoprotectant transport system ATP-binding protein
MIVVKNVSKNFNGTAAVINISFEVNEGETLVLLGTSGCGKTTTLKMLNRLIDTNAGEILISGKNIKDSKQELLRRQIGYVSQNNGLFPHYTVAENIGIVPKLNGWEKVKIAERSAMLLNQIRLPASTFANKFPDELSGGQKQRVALARALASDPPVLLMDEPFGALDPITRAEIRKEFKDLTKANRKTIVLVTHDVQEAFELGDRICLMDKGEIMQIGTAKELIFSPANDFVRNFFSHQRLQLELSSLTLHDIWDTLEASVGSSKADLNVHQTLWEAMELLAASNRKTIIVANGSEMKIVDSKTVNAGYIKIKHNE